MRVDNSPYQSLPVHTLLKKKNKDCVQLDNALISGFTFSFCGSTSYIIDPRGFAVLVIDYHLNQILNDATIINGELIGEYRWCFEDGSIKIIRSDIIESKGLVSEDELLEAKITSGIKGHLYSNGDGKRYEYLGRYYYFEFSMSDRDRSSRRSLNTRCSLDDLMSNVITTSTTETCVSFSTYNKNVYPVHVFREEGKNFDSVLTYKSFVCYDDFGMKPGYDESEFVNNAASISFYSHYGRCSFFVEHTKDYYSKPISSCDHSFTDEQRDIIRNINPNYYVGSGNGNSYVNSDEDTLIYSSYYNISPSKGKKGNMKVDAYSCKLKDGSYKTFTPFGVM